jgi:hypothetical protein
MDFQTITVAVLVGISFVYAAQALMPGAWRVRSLRAMTRWPLPRLLADKLAEKAANASGCGCDGCDRAGGILNRTASALPPTQSKIIFMRRRGS